eukprot:COSAG02_NODE_24431_length_688_cov_0.962649_2_plen_49_part_01
MVPVEQDQRPLAYYNEERVPQLEDLGDGEERHPQDDSTGPIVVLSRLTD